MANLVLLECRWTCNLTHHKLRSWTISCYAFIATAKWSSPHAWPRDIFVHAGVAQIDRARAHNQTVWSNYIYTSRYRYSIKLLCFVFLCSRVHCFDSVITTALTSCSTRRTHMLSDLLICLTKCVRVVHTQCDSTKCVRNSTLSDMWNINSSRYTQRVKQLGLVKVR